MSDKEEMGMQDSGLEGLDPADLLRQGVEEDTMADRLPSFDPPSLEELAEVFHGFEVLALIGQGGMGAVYKVRQRDLERVAALKILPPAVSEEPGFAERFMREARALAKLNHPGIVTLYEFGEAQGLYFFLMEFVDGVNLKQLLSGQRISAREALAIVPQICDALQFAHDQGIVHRDIKPENLLLDRRGIVKVADFGIAKVVGYDEEAGLALSYKSELTLAGKVMGTPDYMAPEQVQTPSQVDHRADIYALGVVFYQMLTGELPGKELKAPSSRRLSLDVRLDEVVLRALEKDPSRRYADVTQLKSRVEEAADTDEERLLEKESGERLDIPSEKTVHGMPLPGNKREERRGWFVKWWLPLGGVGLLTLCALLYSLNSKRDSGTAISPEKREEDVPARVLPVNVEDTLSERQEELLDRLLKQIELSESGRGPNHPENRRAEAELQAFQALNPGLFDDEFREKARQRRNDVLVEYEGLKASGLGATHPKVHQLQKAAEQLGEIAGPKIHREKLLPSPDIKLVNLVTAESSPFQGDILTSAGLTDWSLGVYEVQDIDGFSGEVIESRWFLLSGAKSFLCGVMPSGFRPGNDPPVVPMWDAEFIGDGLSALQVNAGALVGRWYFFEMQLADERSGEGFVRVVEDDGGKVLEWVFNESEVKKSPDDLAIVEMRLVIAEGGEMRLNGREVDLEGVRSELDAVNAGKENSGAVSMMIYTHPQAEFRVMKEILSLCHDAEVKVAMVGATHFPMLRSISWQHQVEMCSGISWLPNGWETPDDDWLPPIEQVKYSDPEGGESSVSFLCLAFSYADFDERSVAEIELRDLASGELLSVPTKKSALRRIPASEKNGGTGWVVASVCAGKRGRIPRKVGVDLRYSVGELKYLSEMHPSATEAKALAGGWMAHKAGEDGEGNAFVEVSRDLAEGKSKTQIGVIAITHGGMRVESWSRSRSSSGKVEQERVGFGVPLSEVRLFEFRSRPIHEVGFPVLLLPDELVEGKVRIDFDRAGQRMQSILNRFRKDYGVHVCFEELGFDPEIDTVTLGARLKRLMAAKEKRGLTKAENDLLGQALELRDKKGVGLDHVIDVGTRYEGAIKVDSVDEFLEELTRGTDYQWKRVDEVDSWIVQPRGISRLDYAVSLSTEGLSVEEAVNKVLDLAPEGAKIGRMKPMVGPVGVGLDPSPHWNVPCVSENFENVPASLALTRIAAEATPDSIWELVGYKDQRFLSLGRSAADSHTIIGEGQAWLAKLDRGEFHEAWEGASRFLHESEVKEEWIETLDEERLPVAKVIRRRMVGAKFFDDLKDEVEVRSLVLNFESLFEEKGRKKEMLTMSLEHDGEWRVSAYEIH